MAEFKDTFIKGGKQVEENIHIHVINPSQTKLVIVIAFFIAIFLIGILYLIDKRRVENTSEKTSYSNKIIDQKVDTIFTILKLLVHNDKVTFTRDSIIDIQLRHFPTSPPIALINMTKIASVFQNRIDPITKKRQMHWGIDYDADENTKVYASAEGIIEEADWNDGYGKYIRINHLNGYETVYAHLNSLKVYKGEHIKKGELIGLVGSTGMSTGNHLHYEIYYLSQHINPAVFTTAY